MNLSQNKNEKHNVELLEFFEEFSTKVLPLMLGELSLHCLKLLEPQQIGSKTSFYSINHNQLQKQIDFIDSVSAFTHNPAFSLKTNFLFNLTRLDKILQSLYPEKNVDSLIQVYLPFVLFTFNSFANNNQLLISNDFAQEIDYDSVGVKKTTINAVDFDKRTKLLISLFLAHKGKPVNNPHHQLIDTILKYLLLDGKEFSQDILVDVEKLNIWFYKQLILTGINKTLIEKELFKLWNNKNSEELDNLLLVLDLSKKLGLSNAESSGFNSPGKQSTLITEFKWIWLHNNVVNFVYSPLNVLIKDKSFFLKIKESSRVRFLTVLVKLSVVKEFTTFLEIKEILNTDKVVSDMDLHIFLSYDKINGFLKNQPNMDILKNTLLNQNLQNVRHLILKNQWVKQELISLAKIYKENVGLQNSANWLISEQMKNLTNTNTLIKESELKAREDEIMSHFNYHKEFLDINYLALFRMMCFILNKRKEPTGEDLIENFVKENYPEFYWEFIEIYLNAKIEYDISKKNEFNVSILNNNFTLINAFAPTSRSREYLQYILLDKKLKDMKNIDENSDSSSSSGDSSDFDAFKL